jgi:hypothetical protein
MGSPVEGSIDSKVRPSAASTHSPPISSFLGPESTKERAASESADAWAVGGIRPS